MENDNNIEILTKIVSALKALDSEAQRRTLQAVITFLDIPMNAITNGTHNRQHDVKADERSSPARGEISFSENRTISPKEFLRDKAPRTDLERVACLAYYLTHYRELPHFKTAEISSLNTEAAQPKFSNTALAVNNAAKAGLLVQALKGSKQISAAGEIFVQALPDRDAARASLANMRIKKRSKKSIVKRPK